MNKEQLEQKEKELDSQIDYMKSIINSSHHSEESKKSAQETLMNLQKQKQDIIQQIIKN